MPSSESLRLVVVQEDGSPSESGVVVPSVGLEVLTSTASLYRRVGYVPPWIGYLAVRGTEAVGGCAFTAPPAANRVEIAYFTFPPHEGRGFATAMARALVEVARRADQDVLVTAHTLPQGSASTRILRNLHFECIGPIEHPEDGTVWEWHLRRDG